MSCRNAIAWCLAVVGLCGVAAPGAGCNPPKVDQFPTARSDDAGDLSWARQVVPIVLGRKVKGRAEAKLLADFVGQTNRATVLRALVQQPEFVDYWSEVLVTALHVEREGNDALSIKDLADCYGAPLRAGPPTGALATHVLTNAPSSPAAGGAFNMSDVVRSALVRDQLASLYRAHLFALQHTADPNPMRGDSQARRDDLGLVFGETFVDRQIFCLKCHNSDESVTGPASGWTRHFPIDGSFEMALYGARGGIALTDAHAMFRTDQQAQNAGGGFIAPWGMSGCGFFAETMPTASGGSPYFTGPLTAGATVTTLAEKLKLGYQNLALDGLNRAVPSTQASQCNICSSNSCTGVTPMDPVQGTNGTFVRDFLASTTAQAPNNCGTCHGVRADLWFTGSSDPWYAHLIGVASAYNGGELRVKPGDSAHSVLIHKLKADTAYGGPMPPAGAQASAADITKFEQWIDSLTPGALCANCANLDCTAHQVTGVEAFAYLTAARIVNVVWREVMGYPVTIANYFPRNPGQRSILWNLTENTFIPQQWSLKELLIRILTSDYFNRNRPSTFATGTPYELPAIYNPWLVPDPRKPPVDTSPEANNNVMADGLYRHGTQNLFVSVHEAMDWPRVVRFPNENDYPTKRFAIAMGEYFSRGKPGSRVTSFPNLLKWEAEHGRCINRAPGGAPDWIGRLETAATTFTPQPGENPLSLKDLLVVERDWLLSDGTIGTAATPPLATSEESALAAVVGPLNTTVSALAPADLDGKLRAVCGILLESPHFLLAGIAPDDLGLTPRLRVCNRPPCTYREMCEDLKEAMSGRGVVVTCGDDSVSVDNFVKEPDDFEVALCPPGGCWLSPVEVPEIDFNGPLVGARATARVAPPSCDPRCSGLACCGGPPPVKAGGGTYVIWADGAEVKRADGVRILRNGGDTAEPLRAGDRLGYGDLVQIPPPGVFEAQNANLKFATNPARKVTRPRVLLVSGRPALVAQGQVPDRAPDKKKLEWSLKFGDLRYPSGMPLRPRQPGDGAPGRTEAEFEKSMRALLGDRYRPLTPPPAPVRVPVRAPSPAPGRTPKK